MPPDPACPAPSAPPHRRSAALGGLIGALAAAAAAGAPLAGHVRAPSEYPPALVVHAWSPSTGRRLTVTTAAGQSTWTIDVPPGRYVVFATPADPGAPRVYAAHTRFSACARDGQRLASGACRDHGLEEIEVGRRRVDGVDVSDWFPDDAAVAEFDRALGRASQAVDEAQLAAPKFSEYPVARAAAAARAPALEGLPDPRLERDRAALAAALEAPATFAGHYAIVAVPCPAGAEPAAAACSAAAVLDLASGRPAWPEPLNPLPGSAPCTDRGALQFRRDSRLLTVTGREGDQLVTRYYAWEGEALRLHLVATLANRLDERCVVVTGR
jgi:hypothetical protein